MSYSEPLVNQIRVFLLSVGMGVPLCLIYVLVQSFFRFLDRKNRLIFVADGLFCLIAFLLSFFFMLFYNGGKVRLHLIMGEALGFYVFYRVVGVMILRCFLKWAELLNKLIGKLLYPFVRVGEAFINIFRQLKTSLRKKTAVIKRRKNDENSAGEHEEKKPEQKRKKFDLFGKKHLQIRNKSV